MKTYYELLGVAADVSADEIKRAFRKEIARYHPDKVQHLGQEFQEIAAVRAAELTEAYRILMDDGQRARYDQGLSEGRVRTAPVPPPPVADTSAAAPPPAASRPAAAPPPGPFESAERRGPAGRNPSNDFVRKAVLAKLREAIAAVAESSDISVRGIDAAFAIRGKSGLFRKGEPNVRLLAKFVGQVDAAAIQSAWPLAMGSGDRGPEVVCLLLLGAGLAPSRDLSAAIAEQRRRARQAGPVLVPVDVRDWEALFPPEAPASVRSILQRLRAGE